jgi:hypothetical protein
MTISDNFVKDCCKKGKVFFGALIADGHGAFTFTEEDGFTFRVVPQELEVIKKHA